MKPTEIPAAIASYCEIQTRADKGHKHRFESRRLELGRNRGWYLVVKVKGVDRGTRVETPHVLVEPVVGMVFTVMGSGPEIATGIAVDFIGDLLEKVS